MDKQDFFKIYISALEKAMLNDHVNYGFHVNGPDWYIENDKIRNEIDLLIESETINNCDLFDMVAKYFDAKSHNFCFIEGVDIIVYRTMIMDEITCLKKIYKME